jgi:threonine synthase
MRYISTRGDTPELTFTDAVLTGLAPDGGLLIPEHIPNVAEHLESWQGISFVELAKRVMPLFVDDISATELAGLIDRAYASFDHEDVVSFVEVGDVQVLELFHGPTLAFKDIALQFLGQLFEHILGARKRHLNILGATSGDTGSAAIAGVRGLPDIDIFIMYPQGRVSALQELQMTTVLDANVHCLAVDGSFDDCQTLMKSLFGDLEFKQRYSLGAVNSVNWARVLAQIVYYGYASLIFARDHHASFVVPTGNFGNVFAGYLAKRMGFPIDKLIVATNENDILSEFFNSGTYRRGEVRYTSSPAMDIQVASNFERFLYYHLDGDSNAVQAFMTEFAQTGCVSIKAPTHDDFLATAVTVAETEASIRQVYEQYNYVADPHTAVGLAAAQRFSVGGAKICFATAHPAKFPETVDSAVGPNRATHPRLDALVGKPARSTAIPATTEAIVDYISTHAH